MNDANQICFVDSNIWLYAFIREQDPDKTQIAGQLLLSAGNQIVISTQVINEVCANLLRKGKRDEATLRDLIHSYYRRYRVVGLNQWVFLRASQIRTAYALSYWDSLIVAAALESGATILYSEDMQSGLVIDNQLTIVNPFIP
jgi:predicted nucleic acid-binding protein